MRNTEGTRAATEHLLAQGRRRIVAFGTDPNMETGRPGCDSRATARRSKPPACPTTQPSLST